MVATGTAVTLIAITMVSLAALTVASLYVLPPVLTPSEEEQAHAAETAVNEA